MADDTTTTTATTETKMMEYPARLQMSMMAPVKAIAASIPEGDKEVRVIGYVFGEARGVSYRNNPNSTDGEPAVGLIGVFEGVPSYEDFPGMDPKAACGLRAGLGSGVCFLPPQLQGVIASQIGADGDVPRNLKRGQRSDQLGVSVPISVEVGIRKSDSPVGYEWVTRALAKVQKMSPLDRMRNALGLAAGADLRQLVNRDEVAAITTGDRKPTNSEVPHVTDQSKPGKAAKPPAKKSKR